MKQEEIVQRAMSRRRLVINAAIAAGDAATIASSSLGFLSAAIAKEGPADNSKAKPPATPGRIEKAML